MITRSLTTGLSTRDSPERGFYYNQSIYLMSWGPTTLLVQQLRAVSPANIRAW